MARSMAEVAGIQRHIFVDWIPLSARGEGDKPAAQLVFIPAARLDLALLFTPVHSNERRLAFCRRLGAWENSFEGLARLEPHEPFSSFWFCLVGGDFAGACSGFGNRHRRTVLSELPDRA